MLSRKITILLVDDHEVVRQGLRAYLDAQPDFTVIGEASSGEEAVEAAMEYLPDVMLMDLVMSGFGGVVATRKVKDVTPRTQIVVLTSYHQDEFIFPALQAGAISYVLKDVMMDDLADAIRKASRGEAVLHPRVAERVIQEINIAKRAIYHPFTELTNREMEILQLIARGMSNSAISDELFISENTVKGHVSNILSKLQLADRTQAAVYAWEQGLVHRTE
ncbi:response regulator transcription factor [Patescibacteria group bacterium]|jgi:NarL family two-component system response regulator LiaR|nr:response regulator transcription factor [Patescibacteria group bacterium]